MDSQSVKNTDTAQEKGYDAGKKVSGIKRHLAVDTAGRPHAIDVTPANSSDIKGGRLLLEANKKHLTEVKTVIVDGAYAGEAFANAVKDALNATVTVVKPFEPHTFKVLPKRWVVERTFAWLDKYRRLWKNCERCLKTSKAMIQVALIALLLRRS